MNHGNADWLAIVINWFPMLLIFGVWLYFLYRMKQRGGYGGDRKRIADALERIATALEKRH
jgi:ATP-dependent Zn protease